MKLLKIFIAALSISLFAGCASLPTPQEMKDAVATFDVPHKPADDSAMVYVVRPSPLGGLIRFNVFLNDKEDESEMGYTRGNQYIYFNIPPGDHQILSKAENWAEVNVNAEAGDIIYIRQEPSMGILMARNSVFKLQEYEGKYHVMKLSEGTVIKTEK